MIKVCHLTSVHNRYDVRIFRKECCSLVNYNYDVTLVVNDNLEDEICSGVKIKSLKRPYKNRIQRILKSSRDMFKFAISLDADIYHFHDPELLFAGYLLKKRGKRVVFDSHENYSMQIKEKKYIPYLIRRVISYIYFCIERFVIKRIDSVIIPCTFEGVNSFQKFAKNTTFIGNYPLLTEMYDAFDENNNNDKDKICYVGSLTYERGVYHIVQASKAANVKLVLAGDFASEKFKSQIEGLIDDRIDYRGLLNREQIVNLYKESFIGVCNILPYGQYHKIDTLATKVFEYMSMGLPVIISDYYYSKNILEKYKFGVAVNPDNISEIRNAINYIKSNPEIASMMGRNGRRAVKEEFNWENEALKINNLYLSFIN